MNYIYYNGLGILVGKFDEEDLKKGIDRIELKKYQEEYPQYKYTNTKIIKEHGIRKLALFICNVNDMKLDF